MGCFINFNQERETMMVIWRVTMQVKNVHSGDIFLMPSNASGNCTALKFARNTTRNFTQKFFSSTFYYINPCDSSISAPQKYYLIKEQLPLITAKSALNYSNYKTIRLIISNSTNNY